MNTSAPPLASAVSEAIEYLRGMFEVTVEPSGDGGAIVTVHGLEIGDRWNPSVIDLIFEVAFNYPFAAIYPYFTTPDLNRSDGEQPQALQRVGWRGVSRTQISRRAARWNPEVDTAAGAVLQVQQWLRTAA